MISRANEAKRPSHLEVPVARPLRFGPPRVRVLLLMENGREEDRSREAQTPYAGADRQEAQRGRSDVGRGHGDAGGLQGAGSVRGDLSPLACAIRRDEGRRREATEGARARELAAQAPGRGQGAGKPGSEGAGEGKLLSPSRR